MATTDIQPFGSGGTGTSNVLTQSAYLTFLASLAGNSFATGAIPTAQQWNKILRQASFMAAGLANWLVNRGITVLDDGNMAALVAEIQAGMSAYLIKSVAGSSDVTLNPTTEANYNIISLTGALTGNINVIVPSRPGSWIFANGTSGAYTITIKCAASATSVIIPQSTTLQVWCDGSHVFATTVVQNANLTGAIISVGNATSLGSFSSAALAAALTDETGSGSIVFNNSPSLLGAPTAPTAATGTSTTQLATTAFAAPGFSLAANGYEKTASGWIIQAGVFTCSSSGPTNLTFPIAFPNQLVSITGNHCDAGTIPGYAVAQFSFSAGLKTSIPAANINPSGPIYNPYKITWLAIGY